ncbi:MAG: tRNA (adenosine(37)-N6)-threonylcarbamoyltransferase complex transferase subunit TsaD [Clostridiales bacterium]|nr:tRNA (adenosine(37)-N6)-threonylcarbamoyltransferase complex transferase subunit TsaD [Clostridiales bacterium]
MSYYNECVEKFHKLKDKKDVVVLSIESSCDETSIAIVKNGREVLANVVASQIDIHRRFGGVVPEVASRNHITAISNIYNEALNEAGIQKEDIDAVAVTYGAGLVGALLVGVNFAKGLAYKLNVPLIAVSHVYGHIAANYISHLDLTPPFVCLMVSGGHTALLRIDDYNKMTLLGSTVDDAIGEAFDKVARVLNLPYPGGPEIDKLAKQGEKKYNFVVSKSLKNTLDFSFSGIKTEVVNLVHNARQKGEEINPSDVACSFQESVTDELVSKAIRACKQENINKLVIAGGVGANSLLKQKANANCEREGIQVYSPVLKYCTDNSAMIGAMAYYMIKDGLGLATLDLTAKPNVNLGV